MKRILISLSIIGVISAAVIGFTIAYFNDTETSAGNIFTAGSIDLKVDHTLATYNGGVCVDNCQEIGANLVVNGGFETPDVPTGGWAIYPDGSQTSWTVDSGAGLEIQDNAAGAPHGGNQLAELDSYNSSIISQMIPTVAGEEYRLTLWYSPRPNVPAGDNTLGVNVKVTSGTVVVINDIIGAGSAGGSNTNWQQIAYNFIATDASTKITFSDLGNNNNSYGGYLDDISIRELDCDGQFPSGGTCALWDEKDLGAGDTFWTFEDVKPGDRGTNVISLHVLSNDAYVCLLTNNVEKLENGLVDPETALGDAGEPGELSDYLMLFVWEDVNGNGLRETGETILYNGNFDGLNGAINVLSLVGNGSTNFGVAWCFGDLIQNGDGTFSCDGSWSQNNKAQTDKLLADLVLYAVQQRNNSNFNCSSVFPTSD